MATKVEAVINEPVTGTKYSRFFRATVNNPVDQSTVVRYETEVLTELSDGRRINEPTVPIEVTLVDKDIKYPVLDHVTGQPTGAVITDYDLADAIYSRYIFSVTA